MSLQSIFDAVLLGIIEGITEFLPVSSTAHLLLSTKLLGLASGGEQAFWDTFNVLIQLGAILAVVVVYFGRLWNVLLALPSQSGGAPLRPFRRDRLHSGGGRRPGCCTISSRPCCSIRPS